MQRRLSKNGGTTRRCPSTIRAEVHRIVIHVAESLTLLQFQLSQMANVLANLDFIVHNRNPSPNSVKMIHARQRYQDMSMRRSIDYVEAFTMMSPAERVR
jgi:hypothetical protein